MTRAWVVAWLFFALPLSFPAVVAAQGIVNAEGRCAPIATGNDCAAGSTCVDAEAVCHTLEPGGGVCAPADALFCATAPSGLCPTGTSPIAWNDTYVCIPPDAHLCGDASSFACFTGRPTPSGPSYFPVAWRLGDCDGDGVPNGLETAEGLCTVRPVIAVTPGDDCITPPGCTGPGTCPADSVCTLVDGTAHRYCVPEDDFVFCCGGNRGIGCPAGNVCQTAPSIDDDYGFCEHFDYCRDFDYADRLSCLEADDDFPVEPDEGDCDGDGVRNVDDVDPCVPEVVVVPDAGAQRDAGPAPDAGEVDGGAIEGDAGEVTLMDAGGAELQPGFSGGGGCRCRAAPPRGGSGALWWWGPAALWIVRRRLRRPVE